MKTGLKYITIILFSLALGKISHGQTNITSQNNKHSINFESFGRTMVWGSINYEYAMLKNLSFGGGLGLIFWENGNISRITNNATEVGTFLNTATTQILYANYFLGKQNHKCLLTAGLTGFSYTYHRKYPSENTNSLEFHLEASAGIGYQYSGNVLYYRATLYVLGVPEPNGWFPKYMPWMGFTIGYKL